MNKIIITFISYTFLFFVSYDVQGQNYIVASLKNQSEVAISNEAIEEYLENYIKEVTIDSKILQKVGENYYLVTNVKEEQKVYAIYLKEENNTLLIDQHKYLHACASDKLSINTFIIENDKIIGCNACNHTIMTMN